MTDEQNLLTDTTRTIAAGLAAKLDERILEYCRLLNMTPEQLAARYAIEYHPMEWVKGEGDTYTVTQNVRFVKRESAP